MNLGWFGAREESIVIDEGGIRLREPNTRYVPFNKISGIRVEDALFDRPRLLLTTDHEGHRHNHEGHEHERVVEATLPNRWTNRINTDLCKTIEQRRDAARATSARMAETRGDIGAWIAMVAASAAMDRDGSLYRSSFVDIELLDRTLGDPTDAIEARAKSAHALLARGRTDLVVPRIGRLSPPLVVAVVRLALGGEKIVSASLLEEIVPFLELRDRIVFTQRARESEEERARVA